MNWNLSDAKNRLSEVLSRASTEGPQTIRRRGEDFILLPKAEFEKLSGHHPTFKDWLLNGPRLDDLNLERDSGTMRDVDL